MAPESSPAPAAAQNAPDEDVVIEVERLVMRFGKQTVLSGLDLKVRRGETLVVMGGSGCGKSTLLSLMIGELRSALARP